MRPTGTLRGLISGPRTARRAKNARRGPTTAAPPGTRRSALLSTPRRSSPARSAPLWVAASAVSTIAPRARCAGTSTVGSTKAFVSPSARAPPTTSPATLAPFASSPATVCIPDCDPLLQDCPGDDLCIPNGENFICVLDASGEAGLYGDPCEYADACKPGLFCYGPEHVEDCKGSGCCTPFCDLNEANICPGDTQECIPWYEEGMAPPGQEHFGICGMAQ